MERRWSEMGVAFFLCGVPSVKRKKVIVDPLPTPSRTPHTHARPETAETNNQPPR
jgi:hypothetical protein